MAVKYNVSCPCCRSAHVSSLKEMWFVYGLIFGMRYGSKTFIGCQACVDKEAKEQVFKNLLGGIWGPSIIFMPFVLLQNFIEISGGQNRSELERVLKKSGINPGEVLLDENGFASEQAAVIRAACFLLKKVVYCEGVLREEELRRSVDVLNKIAGGKLNESKIRELINDGKSSGDFSQLNLDIRQGLLHISLEVLLVDGYLSEKEIVTYYEIAKLLALDAYFAKRLLDSFFEFSNDKKKHGYSDLVMRAYGVLKVSPGATIIEIKQAYRKMMMSYHPDKAGIGSSQKTEFTKIAQEVNWAYETLHEYHAKGGY